MTGNDGPRLTSRQASPASRPIPRRPTAEPGATYLVLSGPVGPADVVELCERAAALLRDGGPDVVVCDVGALVHPDACAVDAMARMQLVARRLGRRLAFRRACGELQDLLVLVGLIDELSCGPELRLEPWGQAEEREQARGVQEEADPGDLPP